MVAVAHKTSAIVVAKRPLLPEFDLFGNDPPARPMRRTPHRADVETQTGHRDGLFELEAAGHRTRLARGPGAELAEPLTRREIRIRFGRTDGLDPTIDPHLAPEFRPVQAERRARIGAQVVGLRAFKIGVEDKAVRIGVLEQHHPHARATADIGGGQSHRRGIVLLRGLRLGQPRLKQR